jgi:hypothetical protein
LRQQFFEVFFGSFESYGGHRVTPCYLAIEVMIPQVIA